jgi:threonine/homoserine/homoserine lactone efflux protein
MDYVWFSLVMLLGQFSPGPDMLLLMKNALSLPLRTAWCTVLGIAVGLMVHTGVALGGLSVLLVRSPVAGRVLGLCGGLYLGWLAWKLLRSAVSGGTTGGIEGRAEVLTPRGAFVQGLVTNLLNPKAVIFLASVLAAMLTLVVAPLIIAIAWLTFRPLLAGSRSRRDPTVDRRGRGYFHRSSCMHTGRVACTQVEMHARMARAGRAVTEQGELRGASEQHRRAAADAPRYDKTHVEYRRTLRLGRKHVLKVSSTESSV